MKVPILLALAALSTAQAAEPTGTLMLACEGTKLFWSQSVQGPVSVPVSMGIIINFGDRTVQGFDYPGGEKLPIKITSVSDTMIVFSGFANPGYRQLDGRIDRVTGDIEARATETSILSRVYSLKCKPTQRMF